MTPDGARAGSPASLPELALETWEPTKDTLHLWTQIVGKVRMAVARPQNHWWHVTLYADPRGLTTRHLESGGVDFDIAFDFVAHELVLRTSGGEVSTFPLADGLSVAAFYEQFTAGLSSLRIEVDIRPEPYRTEVSTTPFAEDVEHASYDPEAVERFNRALQWTDSTLQEFAGWFRGKTSPVHFFWHGFDMAVTRFSGARGAGESERRPGRARGVLPRSDQLRFLARRSEDPGARVLLVYGAGAARAR